VSAVNRGPGRRAAPVFFACLALVAGTAVAGCGGDDEETGPTTTPTIEPATPTGPTGAAGEEGEEQEEPASDDSSVDPEDGTVTPPPESGDQATGGTQDQVDSPENDLPPEPGSPEAQFEQYCDENPEACG
jgi:hypothetical protein